jgi:hypothetical protein
MVAPFALKLKIKERAFRKRAVSEEAIQFALDR